MHRIFIRPQYRGNQLDFFVLDDAQKGQIVWDLPKIVVPEKGYEGYEQPSFTMLYDDGQQITDELFKLGFRPSSNLTRDTSNRDLHLADLRKLVSKAYKVEL